MKTLRLQLSLKVREPRNLTEKEDNYKATLSNCFGVHAKAFALIVGDYKGQFGRTKVYANELISKKRDSMAKIVVENN